MSSLFFLVKVPGRPGEKPVVERTKALLFCLLIEKSFVLTKTREKQQEQQYLGSVKVTKR